MSATLATRARFNPHFSLHSQEVGFLRIRFCSWNQQGWTYSRVESTIIRDIRIFLENTLFSKSYWTENERHEKGQINFCEDKKINVFLFLLKKISNQIHIEQFLQLQYTQQVHFVNVEARKKRKCEHWKKWSGIPVSSILPTLPVQSLWKISRRARARSACEPAFRNNGASRDPLLL